MDPRKVCHMLMIYFVTSFEKFESFSLKSLLNCLNFNIGKSLYEKNYPSFPNEEKIIHWNYVLHKFFEIFGHLETLLKHRTTLDYYSSPYKDINIFFIWNKNLERTNITSPENMSLIFYTYKYSCIVWFWSSKTNLVCWAYTKMQ